MAGNKKLFNIKINYEKAFSVALSVFESVATLLFPMKIRIEFLFIMNVFSKSSSIINLKKITLMVSKVILVVKNSQTINLKRIFISVFVRETGKIFSTITLQHFMSFTSKLIQKTYSNINLKKLSFTFTAILASLYPLSTYDIQTLGTMDVVTLGNLDYVLS